MNPRRPARSLSDLYQGPAGSTSLARAARRATIALAVALTLAGPAVAQSSSSTHGAPCATLSAEAVASFSQRWADLLTSGRTDDLAGLYAEDAVVAVEGRAEPLKGRAAIRAYLRELTLRHASPRITMRAVMARCGLATEMTELRVQVTGKRKGTRMFLGGRTSTVFAQDGSDWRIVQQSLPSMTVPNRTIALVAR